MKINKKPKLKKLKAIITKKENNYKQKATKRKTKRKIKQRNL